MLDKIYNARIPQNWLRYSWQSTTLGFWFNELLERDTQYKNWLNHGKPKVFWINGLFNPQGFYKNIDF
jgi:dynein heavy chain